MLEITIRFLVFGLIASSAILQEVKSCELSQTDREIIKTIKSAEPTSEFFLKGKRLSLKDTNVGVKVYVDRAINFVSKNIGSKQYFLSASNDNDWNYVIYNQGTHLGLNDVALKLRLLLDKESFASHSLCKSYHDVYQYLMHEANEQHFYFPEQDGGAIVISNSVGSDLIIIQQHNRGEFVVERAYID